MSEQAQPAKKTIPTTTNAAASILPPDGWTLRTNLSQEDLQKLFMMRDFIQENVSRVAAMHNALVTFQENQVYLSQVGYQTHDEKVALRCAIQNMMQVTNAHWHRVKLVYVKFVSHGFCPPLPPSQVQAEGHTSCPSACSTKKHAEV